MIMKKLGRINVKLFRSLSVLTLVVIIAFPVVAIAQEPCMNCPTINKEVDISYWLKWQQIPDTINQGQSRTLIIKSQLEEFTWTVNGTGFWFDSQHTKKTIANTGAKAVSLFAAGNACGTATINVRGITANTDLTFSISGDVKGDGRWSNFEMVDRKNVIDICPDANGGCWYYTYTNFDVCESVSNRYDYYYSYCIYGLTGCAPPGCDQNPKPICSENGNACSLTVSDGTCTYTHTNNRCSGVGWVELYRREWVCN